MLPGWSPSFLVSRGAHSFFAVDNRYHNAARHINRDRLTLALPLHHSTFCPCESSSTLALYYSWLFVWVKLSFFELSFPEGTFLVRATSIKKYHLCAHSSSLGVVEVKTSLPWKGLALVIEIMTEIEFLDIVASRSDVILEKFNISLFGLLWTCIAVLGYSDSTRLLWSFKASIV